RCPSRCRHRRRLRGRPRLRARQEEEGENGERKSWKKRRHAARRDSKIASIKDTAWSKFSVLREISRLAVEYTAVSALERSSRSSSEPSRSGPTVARPPR